MDESIRRELLAVLPRLRRFAYSLTGRWDQADDLVQSTYARAIDAIDSWKVGTSLDAWLFRIMRNHFLNQRRAEAVRSHRAEDLRLMAHTNHDGARAQESRLLAKHVMAAIADLPEQQRTALLLVAVEGLSYKEVAGLMDESIGTIASRVARARTTLKTSLDIQAPEATASGRQHEAKEA